MFLQRRQQKGSQHIGRSLPAFAVVLPMLAGAATETGLQRCAQIEAAEQRLVCYDQLAQRPEPAVEMPIQVAEPSIEQTDPAAPQTAVLTPTPVTEGSDIASAEVAQASATNDLRSPMTRAWDLDRDGSDKTFTLRAYRANYFLPVWYNAHPNANPSTPTQGGTELYDDEIKHTEAKFQISFKTKMWNDMFGSPVDLWFGYTQQSHWQIYNSAWSSPFRDTDYEPEIIATMPLDSELFGMKVRMLGLGVVHQSNGQSDPLSRSWNRAYGMVGLERGDFSLLARAWYRFPDHNDDNPDITDYMGHGDVQAIYRWNKHTFGLMGRLNASTGKGALRLDWTFPIFGGLRGYVQYFNGYGENLLDYNHRNNSIGAGFLVTDLEGQ